MTVNSEKSASKARALQRKALQALRVAVRKTIRKKRLAGLPIYVSRTGKVINLNPQRRSKAKSRRAA
jgi:hypothetical protein